MEDLREVGEKAIASVNKLGASDAGDLVLGIGEIIEQLRQKPDLYSEKLDHLEGLFREFAFGEGYRLRNDRTEEKEEERNILGGMGTLSGVLNVPTWTSNVAKPSISPVKQSQEELNEEQERLNVAQERLNNAWNNVTLPGDPDMALAPPEPKKFKKRWWNKKV